VFSRALIKYVSGNLIHRQLVVVAREEMPVPIHRHLQRRMSRERLHGLRRKPRLDPRRDRKVAQPVPAKPLRCARLEEGRKSTLHKIIMSDVAAAPISEDQIAPFGGLQDAQLRPAYTWAMDNG
jgi:hypothetical protein